MAAAWMVRSRQLQSQFRFWLLLAGYRPQDKSFSQKLYLVYAAAFYALWFFAVLALLASVTGQALAATGVTPLPAAALSISLVGLLAWVLLSATRAAWRCPLAFSEADAYLICLTPVDRRALAVVWLIGQWPASAAAVAAVIVTLAFALTDWSLGGNVATTDIPLYLAAGLRALPVVLVLHAGLLALAWALGNLRLQRDTERPGLVLLPAAVALVLAIGPALSGSGIWLARFVSPPWRGILGPLLVPLAAALGQEGWLRGMGLAGAWALGGVACLWLSAGSLNLSRAAQEARHLPARPARRAADKPSLASPRPSATAQSTQSVPHLLPNWPGPAALIAKDIVQAARAGRARLVTTWFLLFVLTGGGLLVENAPARMWALLAWFVLINRGATRRLQEDLGRWTIVRLLPLPAGRFLLGEIAVFWFGAVLATWAGLLATAGRAVPLDRFAVAALVPAVILAIALAAALDVVRQSQGSELLAGSVPQPAMLSIFAGAATTAVAVLILGMTRAGVPTVLPAALALVLTGGIAYVLWLVAADRLRRLA